MSNDYDSRKYKSFVEYEKGFAIIEQVDRNFYQLPNTQISQMINRAVGYFQAAIRINDHPAPVQAARAKINELKEYRRKHNL